MRNAIQSIVDGRKPRLSIRTTVAVVCTLAVVLLTLSVASPAAWAQGLPLRTCPSGTNAYLCRGDIVVADPSAGPSGSGALFLINPSNGTQTLISSGNLLTETVGAVIEANGTIVATDRIKGIVRVDPATGGQTLLSAATASNDFFGIARDNNGDFIVADSGLNSDKVLLVPPGIPGRIIRIDKTTGAQSVIAQGGNIVHPYGVAIDPLDLSIVVSDMASFGGQGAIIRMDSLGGNQQVVWGPASASPQVPQSAPFNCPMGIAVENTGNVLATVFSYFAYGCSNPGIFRVDLINHVQVTVSANPPVGWQLPFGITTEETNNILVVDELLRGIYRLTPSGSFTGQTPLSGRDQPSTPNFLVSPVGVSVAKSQPGVNTGQPPTVSINGAPASGAEGTTISLTSTVSGAGTLTYAWSVTKNGNPFASGSGTGLSFTPDDNGAYVVNLAVTNTDGTGTDGKSIPVINLPPAVTINGAPATAVVGTAINLTSTVFDPSPVDSASVFTFAWAVTKNGNPFVSGSAGSFSFTPDANGTYVVTLSVTDKDGGTGTANKTIATGAQGLPLRTCPNGTNAYLCRGDIIVADPSAGPSGSGALFLINPSNGTQTLISSGNLLSETVGAVIEANGNIVATDRVKGIVRVDPATGGQTLLAAATASNDFFGIARDNNGDFIVADSGLNSDKVLLVPPGIPGRIIRIDKTTGAQSVIAQGGNIVHPYGVVIDPLDSSIVVSDMSSFSGQGAILRMNSLGGNQQVVWGPASASPQVPQSAPFNCPMGIAVENTGNVLATVFSYFAYGCSNPGIFRVDLINHVQVTVSANPPVGWQLPFGITTEETNNILVVDELLRGIYRLTPSGSFTGQTPLSGRDQPSTPNFLISPVGITVPKFQPGVNTGQPPAVSINGAPASSPEGTAINLTSTATGLGTFTYAWSVTRNGNPFTSGSGTGLSFTPDDNGTYAVTLNVTNTGGTGTDSKTITVTNVSPTVGINNVPASSPEGTAISLTSTVTDPSSADTAAGFTYSWTVNGNPSGSGTSLTFTPNDNGTYAVTLTVTDKDGSTGTDSRSITITNVAPGVGITNAPASSPEGTAISLTSTVTDPSSADTAAGFTYSWTVNGNPSGSGTSLTFTPNDNGTYVVTLTVTDKDGGTGTDNRSITITNVAPTGTINGAPASSVVGTPIALTSTVADPGSLDTFTYAWSVTRNGSAFTTGTTSTLNFTPNAAGSYVVTLTVTDNYPASGTDSRTVNVVDVPPGVSIVGAPASSPEGTAINLTSTASGTGTLAYAWGVTKNGSSFAAGSGPALSFTPDDNGTYVVSLAVTNTGGTATDSKTINVTNVAPTVLGLPTLVSIGTGTTITTSFTATFTDPGTRDTHTCTLSWDDGSSASSGVVTETNGSGSCKGTHTYSHTGVYTVTATVTDNDGGSASDGDFLVVYDPTAGYVSGSGFVNSPAGAYTPIPSAKGKASFGFNTRYQLGSTVPSGPTTFNFTCTPANLKFSGVVYEWLVVTAPAAQFKGSGTINGAGNYGFIVTAVDGQQVGGSGVDKFRIKIWNINADGSQGTTVYDNVMGAPEDMNHASPQDIASGDVLVFLDTAPSAVSSVIQPSAVAENFEYSRLASSFTDPDLGDPHTATVDWGDGSAVSTVQVPAGNFSFTADHLYVQNNATATPPNVYNVKVTVGDSYGKISAPGTTPVTVTNVAPIITSGTWPTGPVTVGSPATVKANFTDQGILDTHTCSFAWGDSTTSSGVVTETSAAPPASFMSGSCTASHNYTAAGTYTVYVTTFDNDNASAVSGAITITVTAANTAPVLSPLSITNPVKENVNATLSGSFTDQNSTGTHKVTYEWGDGTANTVQTLSATIFNFSATHKYANDTPAVTVTVTVTDSGNLSDSKTLTFAVINVAPAITSGSVPATTKILPGGTVTISPAFTDAPLDAHTCDYVWETGGATETVTASPATGNGSCTKSHTYPNAGIYNGSVTVKDDAGATATATFKVTVDTKPSNLTLAAPSQITENDTATVSGSFTDPDSTHKITIAWGDGSANTVVNLAAAVLTFSSTHKYKDNNPATTPDGYAVTVTVLDNNSLDSISGSTTIKVNNALPQITSTGSNVSLPLWINFTDAGTLDTHTCAVTWGDGQTGSGVVSETNGSGYCSASHSYSSSGTYTVGVTITDKDGGSATGNYQYVKP